MIRNRLFRSGLSLAVLLVVSLGGPLVRPAAGLVGCDVTLSMVGGPETDGTLTVREWQDFAVHGYGFPASTAIVIAFDRPDAYADFDTMTDGDGAFAEIFWFSSDELPTWTVSAYQAPSDWCPDSAGLQILPGSPFTDAEGNTFEREIAFLYQNDITKGCSTTLFCPDDPVTRGQMAAFLVRALGLPPTSTDYFTDDATSTFQGDINRLAASGITKGCSPTTFCPDANVTRGQMAAFLVRALGLPPASSDYFADDATSTFQGDINRLAASGITKGCSPTTFCPDANVTRGQMAAFLYRGLISLASVSSSYPSYDGRPVHH